MGGTRPTGGPWPQMGRAPAFGRRRRGAVDVAHHRLAVQPLAPARLDLGVVRILAVDGPTRYVRRDGEAARAAVVAVAAGVAVVALAEGLGEVEARDAVRVRGHVQREHHRELPRAHVLRLGDVGDVAAQPLFDHQCDVGRPAARHVLAPAREVGWIRRRPRGGRKIVASSRRDRGESRKIAASSRSSAHVRLGQIDRRVGLAHVGVRVEQQPQPEVAQVPGGDTRRVPT